MLSVFLNRRCINYKNIRLFSHDGKVRILNFNSRCAFWIKIQNTQKRPCVCQITSQNVIWNAHLKSRYRGVFQLRFSQITQRNLCMNDLTSESCFGGRSSCDLLTISTYNTARCTCKGNVNNTRACLIGRQPRHSHASSPRSRKENHIRSLVCIMRNSKYASTSIMCALRNSKCAFRIKIQNTHFAVVWKQS